MVRDKAPGFDMKYADKLFAVFQRLHSPPTSRAPGIGLEPSAHHQPARGRIWAEARRSGATFTSPCDGPLAAGLELL